MSLIDSNNILLREQLGKGKCDVIGTTAMTGKDYYAVHFITPSVITSITIAGATDAAGSALSNLHTSICCGTVIYGRVTAINLASGAAICYYETDEKTNE